MIRMVGLSREAFSGPQLRDLIGELAHFPRTVRERGRQYAAQGRVGPRTRATDSVSAIVRGSLGYHVAWQWLDGTWFSECDCPVGPDCKHAYALACHILLESPAVAALQDQRLQHLLPPALRNGSSPRIAQLSAVAGTPSAGRPNAPVRKLLDRLRSVPDPWMRQHIIAELIDQRVASRFNLYLPPFPQILEEADPELLCWRLAHEIAKRAEGWVPRALESFRERPDLAERLLERARREATDELTRWARRPRSDPKRRLRLVLGLAADSSGDAYVTAEARLTTPRLNDQPRTMTQLQQLRGEVYRTTGLLRSEEVALLEWLVNHNLGGTSPYGYSEMSSPRLTTTQLRALVSHIADSPLATWGTDLPPDLAARAGLAPGARIQLSPAPARLLPMCQSREHTAWIDFVFLWPDGRQRALADAVYLCGRSEYVTAQPSFVLVDGVLSLVTEEPPASLVRSMRETGGLPLAAGERRPMLELLATNFPHLRDALAARTTFHIVQPVFTFDLREDDWMQVRLFASSVAWVPDTPVPEDAVVFEYTADRCWTRVAEHLVDQEGAPLRCVTVAGDAGLPVTERPLAQPQDTASSDEEKWLEAPEPKHVESAAAWLNTLPVGPGDGKSPGRRQERWHGIGWWMFASRKAMERLATAWEERPAGVSIFGNERIHRLLSGDVQATPRIQVTSSGLDWFAVSAEWKAEGLQLTDADYAKLRSADTRFVKLSSGWVRRDVVDERDEAATILADLGVEAGRGDQRVTVWQLVGAKAETLEALERFAADAHALEAARHLRDRVAQFTGLPAVAPPPEFTADLRPYQQHGLDFLAYTSSLGIGAVLADDMGLGKTVQALAWITYLRQQDPAGGPTLVVCPASVVHNWAREAERFAPGLRVLLLTRGSARHELRKDIPAHDLVVTNYALLRRDLDEWRNVEWRALILDEAQFVKNPDAAVTRAAHAVSARHRLALTGTPLENRALDLWSIMSVVNPGYLGNRAEFERRFDRIDAPAHVRTLLAAKLRPVLLRRTKQAVAPDLPDRIEERRDCELMKEQRQLYLAELRRSRALVEQLSEEPGGIAQNKIHILAALTRLRQICCHPALAGGKGTLTSGKFEALFELLEPLLAEGHKVLVFSQFVECLKLLQAQMRVRGIVSHILTGATTKRGQVVDAFQNDPQACVFLISLKAGGTGLNLTAASYVVLFDPWWNPAVEAQAIDRTHRIGQDRTVIAYRLLATGTIEEKIWELQQRKAALARDVLGEGGFARTLTRGDLDYLLAET
jgi:superfamily II DNA or RNA helicase